MNSTEADRPTMPPVNPPTEQPPPQRYRPARQICGHCAHVEPHGMVAIDPKGKNKFWMGTCKVPDSPGEQAPKNWPKVNCDSDKCGLWVEEETVPTMTAPGRAVVPQDRPRYAVVIFRGPHERVVGVKASEEDAYRLMDIWVLRGEKVRVVDRWANQENAGDVAPLQTDLP